jgi:molybdopterin synthase sulfur carrier subunit
MINVLFFAQTRELVGTGSITVTRDYATVDELRAVLAAKGDRWSLALESGKVLSAVNQTLVSPQHALKEGDEVAFFPPVTGG